MYKKMLLFFQKTFAHEFFYYLCGIFDAELHRILIHGVLHLTGQGDKTPETRAEMTRKENLALAKLG